MKGYERRALTDVVLVTFCRGGGFVTTLLLLEFNLNNVRVAEPH